MNGSILFILHGPKEAGFAAKLAPTFEPIAALPLVFEANLGGRSVSYGPAATCLVLLDQALAAYADVIARTASPATTVICRNADVALPEVLATYCVVDRKVFEITAPALHEVVARKIKEAAAGRDAAQRISSHAPAMQREIVNGPGKSSLLTRSAWGLAATAVVAGIAAPAIGGRAGAASVADADPIGGVSEASDVVTVTRPIQIAAVAPQYYEPPPLADLLDHIDRNQPAAPEPAATALAAEEPAALEPLLTSLNVPVEPDVSGTVSVIAPVARAGQPKGGAAPAEAPEKPQAPPEPVKQSP
ncbi:MAG: hypothetical protein ACK4X1_15570 [Terricaulis sp.]